MFQNLGYGIFCPFHCVRYCSVDVIEHGFHVFPLLCKRSPRFFDLQILLCDLCNHVLELGYFKILFCRYLILISLSPTVLKYLMRTVCKLFLSVVESCGPDIIFPEEICNLDSSVHAFHHDFQLFLSVIHFLL